MLPGLFGTVSKQVRVKHNLEHLELTFCTHTFVAIYYLIKIQYIEVNSNFFYYLHIFKLYIFNVLPYGTIQPLFTVQHVTFC